MEIRLRDQLRLCTQAFDQAWATMGPEAVTPQQLQVLACINDIQGCSQTDIVEKTGIDRSTTSDIVKRLITKGFLARRRSRQDARAYTVNLTSQGKKALEEGLKIASNIEAAIPKTVTKELGALLPKMQSSVGAMITPSL